MANYIGVHCPVCNKRFVEGDDIVVCPICGAPHHRSCYQQTGHCALEELHMKGHVWKHPQEQQPHSSQEQTSDILVCPSCGANNPSNGLFCQVCGSPLSSKAASQSEPSSFHGFGQPFGYTEPRGHAQNAYTMAFGGVDPNEEIQGISARDIALFVGENSHYFLPRFHQMAKGSPVSFNLPALFFNFLYFFYRKMYGIGSCLLLLFAISQIPALLIAQEYTAWVLANIEDISVGILPVFTPQQHLWAYQIIPFLRIFLIVISILSCLFANRLYMAHTISCIKKLKAQFTSADGYYDDRLYSEALAQKGHTSRKAVVILLVSCIVLYLGSCFVTAWMLL